MKVSGITFIKNAIKYDYPIVEAITSLLPLCDEFIVAVGKSDDATLDLIKSINNPKIRIIETVWDESLREGGRVLASETNKAMAAVSPDSDWIFYIQGDEAVHEKYHPVILKSMEKHKANTNVDGLLFKYLHFYGSFDFVGASSNWYSHEIRIIKNNKAIYSYKDAQGFRKNDDEKLNVVPIDAYVYHYGWVREPAKMQDKIQNFNILYHDDNWLAANNPTYDNFAYEKHVSQVKSFTGTHPYVMQQRIAAKNWKFDCDIRFSKRRPKDIAKSILATYFGIQLGYRNYRIIRP